MIRALVVAVLFGLGCGATASDPPPVAPSPESSSTATEPVATQPVAPKPVATKPVAESAKQPAKAHVAPPAVVGSWKATGAGFHQITLNADGTFSSFLHQRPFASGTWKLVKADGEYRLVLSSAAGNDTLHGVRRDKQGLVVHVDGAAVVWQPIR